MTQSNDGRHARHTDQLGVAVVSEGKHLVRRGHDQASFVDHPLGLGKGDGLGTNAPHDSHP